MRTLAVLLLAASTVLGCGEGDPARPAWAVGSWRMSRDDALRLAEEWHDVMRSVLKASGESAADLDAAYTQVVKDVKAGKLNLLTLSGDGTASNQDNAGSGAVAGTWSVDGEQIRIRWFAPAVSEAVTRPQQDDWTLSRSGPELVRKGTGLEARYERVQGN